MSKNGRNRHKGKGTGGAGAPGARTAAPQSLSAVRADRAVDALTPAFVRWFEGVSPGSAVAALECLEPIKAILGRYMDTTDAADVTRLEPFGLSVAVSEEILAALDGAGDVAGDVAGGAGAFESTTYIVHSVGAFVEFLVETGRWSGSEDQLAAVMDFLDMTAEDGDGGAGSVEVPDIPDEEALAAFSQLPLIQRVTALLHWIGEGKEVTATGALRLRDIEAAAACVGVVVRGGTKRSGSPLPGAGAADQVPTVRSMYEVPLLALLWNVLEAAELIEVKSAKVVPSTEGGVFRTGGTSGRLGELVFIVDLFLETAVLGWDPAQPWERLVSSMQASILLAAATADPPETARILAAPSLAPPAERAMADLLTGVAMTRLEELAGLGLLTIDSHIRVPPALIRCIANVFDDDWVLADLGLGEASDDDAGREPLRQRQAAPGTSAPAMSVVPELPAMSAVPGAPRAAGGPVVQLKVMLNNSKPPVWRRVLVPAGMPLPQLHQVIQTLFGWFDYHLHEFRTGGIRGPVYAPVNPDGDDDFYGDASLDESKVTVGELLPAVGSTMSYTYDFGDNWALAIKAEKILPDDGGRQLPRCTAGRGAAPAEDSGGTWGWANVVQAVNDPSHEEHKEYREWLGMLPGETLDPKAFDVDDANEDLADLF